MDELELMIFLLQRCIQVENMWENGAQKLKEAHRTLIISFSTNSSLSLKKYELSCNIRFCNNYCKLLWKFLKYTECYRPTVDVKLGVRRSG